MGGGSGVDTDTGTGLHLLSLLTILLFVLPALVVVTWRAWGHCLRRRRNARLPPPPVSRGLAAVYPLRWVYRCGDEWTGGVDAIELDTRVCARVGVFLFLGGGGGSAGVGSSRLFASRVGSVGGFHIDTYNT